jgi:hypothetical protein
MKGRFLLVLGEAGDLVAALGEAVRPGAAHGLGVVASSGRGKIVVKSGSAA